MKCSEGRVDLSKGDERRLFAESAGTCLLCSTTLFVVTASGRSMSVAERAHVVAHSKSGPRGKEDVPGGDRDGPENIVLVCPRCHTIIDQDPDSTPAADLIRRKSARAAAVAQIGGTPLFAGRADAWQTARTILARNRTIWKSFGPESAEEREVTDEDAEHWSARVLDEIVPGNELLVAMVRMNPSLVSDRELEIATLLEAHTAALRSRHAGGLVVAPARRFPEGAERLFSGGFDG